MPGAPVRPSAPTMPGGPGGPWSSGAVSKSDNKTLELQPH